MWHKLVEQVHYLCLLSCGHIVGGREFVKSVEICLMYRPLLLPNIIMSIIAIVFRIIIYMKKSMVAIAWVEYQVAGQRNNMLVPFSICPHQPDEIMYFYGFPSFQNQLLKENQDNTVWTMVDSDESYAKLHPTNMHGR